MLTAPFHETWPGIRILLAETGEEALDVVKAEQPDGVILDLALPDMPGLDVCTRLRGTYTRPILVVTAHVNYRKEALEAGADEYIPKPFSHKEYG